MAELQAAIEILFMALGTSLFSSLIRRFMLKEDDIRKMQEAAQYRRDMMKAMREGDKKTIQKLERKKEYIQKIEAQTAMKNLAITMISIAVFLGFYFWASSYYGDTAILEMPPGLRLPFISNEDGEIFFYGWYILSVFSVGLPINKFLSPAMPSLFGGGAVAEKKSSVKESEKG